MTGEVNNWGVVVTSLTFHTNLVKNYGMYGVASDQQNHVHQLVGHLAYISGRVGAAIDSLTFHFIV